MKGILRIITAIIFIISGFVKAIDVRGFSFKLEEYFSPTVFDIPWFEENTLPIAIFVVAFELLLGITLLLKIRVKQTLFCLIGLCVFFAFLTFYSAYFNKVTDCGCFGDAIKFTPWQSFWKDIILLLGLIILWISYRKNHKISNNLFQKLAFSLLIIGFGLITVYGLIHEPLIDFRDYKIGTNLISERKKIEQNPDVYQNIYTLKHLTTNEEKIVSQDEYLENESYWQEGSPWKIISKKTRSELVKQGYSSEIKKLKIEQNGNDLTEEILRQPLATLLFCYAPKKLSAEEIATAESAIQGNGYTITVAPAYDVFSKIPQATMDGTAIKTIARSNPFVLVLKNGVIVEKTSIKDYIKNN